MLIDSATLYFKEGVSDKVYNATIEEIKDGYVVNFSYGRRGSALKAGTKTNNPVTKEQAKKIFDSLLKEKTGKGYKKLEGEGQNIIVPENLPDTPTESKCVLLNSIEESQVEKYLNDDNWLAQSKYDGVRFMLYKEDQKVSAYNRRGLFANIPVAIWNDSQKCKNFLIDGELIGENYYVFDVLQYEDKEIVELPLVERLKFLENFKEVSDSIKIAESYFTKQEKAKFFEESKKNNEEGIVFKKKDAKYYVGRPASGGNYLKYKFYATCSCFVTEINEDKRSVYVGLLHGKKLVSAGKVTIPVNHEVPEVGSIVEVRYLYAYKQSGNLYQPTYLGLREDILDTDCQTTQLKYKKEED
jgi:bifunctional non-homologous end joining protein LigD